MPRDDDLYVGHMLDMTRKALELARGVDKTSFDADEKLQLALVHLIQVIGEAARRVSPEFQVRHPDIPWGAIVGMRHKVVHDYMGVDIEVVWDTVQNDLPGLSRMLESIAGEEG
jgi:uncharacterized protein with HEPN domain